MDDDGTVVIASTDGEAGEACQAEWKPSVRKSRLALYEGKVVSVKDFGCFVEIAQGTDGMLHISELDNGYVEKVENVVKVGDKIKVKVINVDDSGRMLSRKALLKDEERPKLRRLIRPESHSGVFEAAGLVVGWG